jgi:hypothetical protein
MATCSLCPPGSRDIAGREMDEHRRTVHSESVHSQSGEDGTLQVGGSTIVRDASDDTAAEVDGEDGEWHH